VDSYCLQCIVFDEERQALFAAVRSGLACQGYYLVSSAILDAHHEAQIQIDETVTDQATGTIYTGYSGDLIDLATGIVLQPLPEGWPDLPDARQIAGRWYLPQRRHLRAKALHDELTQAGFHIVRQASHHAGNVLCVRDGSP
jgi:hypothetical protein